MQSTFLTVKAATSLMRCSDFRPEVRDSTSTSLLKSDGDEEGGLLILSPCRFESFDGEAEPPAEVALERYSFKQKYNGSVECWSL